MSVGQLRPQDIKDEIRAFKMPKVYQGQPVVWYKDGTKNANVFTIGLIIKATPANVTLLLPEFRQSRRDAVPHVNDPRLKLGTDHRENGAWDFTPYHREMLSGDGIDSTDLSGTIEQLANRLDTMQAALDALAVSSDEAEDAPAPKKKTPRRTQGASAPS